jgi:hypothetical protein
MVIAILSAVWLKKQLPRHTRPKTSSENGLFVKEDTNTYKCALLLIIVIIICILLYRIGNGGNKLFVFAFVFVGR